MARIISICFFLILGLHSFGSQAVDKFTRNEMLKNANISLLVKDISLGKTVHEYNPNNSLITASVMKVVTTATALEMYGPDYKFETKLEIDGEITKEGVLNGNLYIKGSGDPTLGSDKIGDRDFLSKWVQAVLNAGIKEINGKIIANNYFFEQQAVNPKWTWEDMGNYYAPGIYGISYLDNTFRVVFKTGKIGSKPEIIKIHPEIPNLSIQNYVNITDTKSDNAYFYGAPLSYERAIYGEIPANNIEFPVKGDIPNPGLLLAMDFHKMLVEAGCLILEAPISERIENCKKFSIYTHFSPPMNEIITEINVNSNNLYAECLLKLIGAKTKIPGQVDIALANVKTYWKNKGLSVDELFQCDGSGLSPSNAVSANFFVEILSFMKQKSKHSEVFYQSLPVSGINGTLKTLLENTALKGKVRAKSGTISRVKSYTGFVETKNSLLVFAVIVNNANGSSREVTKKIEEFLLDIAK